MANMGVTMDQYQVNKHGAGPAVSFDMTRMQEFLKGLFYIINIIVLTSVTRMNRDFQILLTIYHSGIYRTGETGPCFRQPIYRAYRRTV